MTVSDLDGFPFSSFSEYRAASSVGIAGLRVDTELAIRLAGAGKFGRISQAFVFAMLTLPWVIAIAILVYALIRNVWLLFGLPLLFLAYLFSHPATAFMRRMLRPLMFLVILFVAAMTAYELFMGNHPGMALLGGAILAIIAANLALLSLAVKVLIHRANSEEEFLCALWKSNAVKLTTANGAEYPPKQRSDLSV